MKRTVGATSFYALANTVGVAVGALFLCCTLTGCLVAGYSSGGGFWVWPGSVVLTLLVLLFLFMRGRH